MKKYILGILTAICVIPLLESLTEVIQVAMEIPKGILSRYVIKINSELQELQMEGEPINTNCIGFQIPSEDCDIDIDNSTREIGFKDNIRMKG